MRELDEKGAVTAGKPGAPDVAPLIALARDRGATIANRNHALVILGQIGRGARAAIGPLRELVNDPSLGPTAARSIQLIEGAS